MGNTNNTNNTKHQESTEELLRRLGVTRTHSQTTKKEAKAKAKAEREREAEKRRQQKEAEERKKEKERERAERQKSREEIPNKRGQWQRKDYKPKHESNKASTERKDRPTVKQGWVAHEEAWEAFVTSVADNPSAPIPWPKPNLLTKYLASAAADLSDVATQTYRDLIR